LGKDIVDAALFGKADKEDVSEAVDVRNGAN
jgi:hypothetical protein